MTQPVQNNSIDSARFDALSVVQPRVRVGRDANHSKKETSIKLNRNGTVIESIQITCACGEEIVVNCVYQEEAK